MSRLSFAVDGVEHFPGAADAMLPALARLYQRLPVDRPGLRLHDMPELAEILDLSGSITAVAKSALGAGARPVRALAFDKTEKNNWALAWHQDRTIAVMQKREVAGFGPWTEKRGMVHVAPPIEILERMVTLRIHLDAVSEENAPLLVAIGSHRLGRVAEHEVKLAIAHSQIAICCAAPGDVWMTATPILHASDAAVEPHHRRVLQVDYTAFELPGGLEWLGV